LILSALFEGLEIDATIITGTAFVLAGNLFVLKTRRTDVVDVVPTKTANVTALATTDGYAQLQQCRD
jgi:hypothetical protein